jgi:hypothetical protein
MIERLKQRLRPKAQQKVDNLVGDLYVREEAFEAALKASIDELTRVLANRFDAEAEVNAIIGQRVAALVTAVEALRDEVQALRGEVAAQRVRASDGGAGEDRPERTWSHRG